MIDYSKERQPPYTRNLRYIPITDRRYAYSIGTESGVIVDSIKFNDWQEMALKKDTEAIIKKLNSQEPIFFSLCWEIVLAMGAIIVDHLSDTQQVNAYVWILWVIIAVFPPIIILLSKVTCWIRAISRAKAGNYNIRAFVDSFDNQICYWVMMCTSYSRILSNSRDTSISQRVFLYQEGSYYLNKSIHALEAMLPVCDKVFSIDPQQIIDDNLVSVYRLQNILELIQFQRNDLNSKTRDISNNKLILEQIQINDTFDKRMLDFVKTINDKFNLELPLTPSSESNNPQQAT